MTKNAQCSSVSLYSYCGTDSRRSAARQFHSNDQHMHMSGL